MNSIIEKSYLNHVDAERDYRARGLIPSCYSNPESIDAWRHNRMRKTIIPLLISFPNSKWITIGDGSFGSDAHYLERKGMDVLSTSISDETIAYAHQQGYIKRYKIENAEKINQDDDSFDFVFCKESFHHLPRPYMGIYEMLRISRKGVVLIEPQEGRTRLFDIFKKVIKITLRKNSIENFEYTGNYIFRANISELAKVMTALNHKTIVFKRFNDFFHASLSSKSSKSLNSAKLFTQLGIELQNFLCKLGLMNYGLVTIILFKDKVSSDLINKLKKDGFIIRHLPQNPYLPDSI